MATEKQGCKKAKKHTDAARIEANKARKIAHDARLKALAKAKDAHHGATRQARREQARLLPPPSRLDPERFNPALATKEIEHLIRRAS